jgi:hypothetical protein
MNVPFTVEQFFDVFARYNTTLWAAPVVLNALALAVIYLVYRARPRDGQWIGGLLALMWVWMAAAYHFAYFTAINPAAWVFGTAFLLSAGWLAWVSIGQSRLEFGVRRGFLVWAGAALVAFALVVYPALGYAVGHRYPAVPTFGLPCPTTIFTIGVLLMAKPPVPRSLFIMPIVWAGIGSTAAFSLAVYQDLGLLIAGLVALIAITVQPRQTTATSAARTA